LRTQMSLSHPNDAVKQTEEVDHGFRSHHKNELNVLKNR